MKHMFIVAACLTASVAHAEARWPAHGLFAVAEGRDAEGRPNCGLKGSMTIQERVVALALEMDHGKDSHAILTHRPLVGLAGTFALCVSRRTPS